MGRPRKHAVAGSETTATMSAGPDATPGGSAGGDHDAARWAELARASVGRKKAAPRVLVEWVFNNLAVPLDAIAVESVPSSGAVGLLRWARASPSNEGSFLTTIWPKLMPNRSAVESDMKFGDDGRSVISLIDKVLAASRGETLVLRERGGDGADSGAVVPGAAAAGSGTRSAVGSGSAGGGDAEAAA